MTIGNLINTFNYFINAISFKRKLSDEQIGCTQFGICNYSPKKVEEVPFFITN